MISYLQPVHNAMLVLIFMFLADMAFGILTDLFVNRKRFNPKKFMLAFFYVAIYLSIVSSIYVIGEHMGDVEESLFVVKTITYVFIYFYMTNTFRNLKTMFPNNKPIVFLEFVLCLEFTKRIPGLDEFLKRDIKEVNDNKTFNE